MCSLRWLLMIVLVFKQHVSVAGRCRSGHGHIEVQSCVTLETKDTCIPLGAYICLCTVADQIGLRRG